MTQEWFESADFEKTANNDKKDIPSNPVIPQEEIKEKDRRKTGKKAVMKRQKKAVLKKVKNIKYQQEIFVQV